MRSVVLGAVIALAMALSPAATASEVHHRDFSFRSTAIDNQWLPLTPGTQFTLQGTADRGGGPTDHEVVLTVTDLTKRVDGVRTLVLWDRDFNGRELAEEELALHAQDDEGNVWNLGEYPEETEDGRFVGAPSTWLSSRAGASGGIVMSADPRPGTPTYVEGVAPRIDFFDVAQVLARHRSTCVPAGCYGDLLVVDEWAPLDQPEDGHQLKFFAPGVGNVRIEARGGVERETLVLTKVRRLGPAEMAAARSRALELDRRAYRFAADVWGGTARAEAL
jgi:hypothetical protein